MAKEQSSIKTAIPPAQPPPTEQKPAVNAVDYPVVICPFCTSKNTMRLPERSPAAVRENWWKRKCRECDQTFKARQ